MLKNILILGSGGRENAIAEAFVKSSKVSEIYVMPGNDGIAKNFKTLPQQDFDGIYGLIKEKNIDLVFVGGEQLLSEGIVDFLSQKGIKVVGPTKAAAQIESSKAFAKNIMKKYNIPTAGYEVFTDFSNAVSYLKNKEYPVVLKADGLAAGKGVLIAETFIEAETYLKDILLNKKFGNAGSSVVIEDFLKGEEASVFAFSDGVDFVSTIMAQDHKRAEDNDRGPNTGGMGAYAPVDKFKHLKGKVDEEIFKPVLEAMNKEGYPFKGILYAGLMIYENEVSIVEFNCRFGDPETQAVLPLLKTDFYDISEAIVDNRISSIKLDWENKYAVNIVLASKGYPEDFQKGLAIDISPEVFSDSKLKIYYAGVKYSSALNSLVNSGGRVLNLCCFHDTLEKAVNYAYNKINLIKSDILRFRTDIGKKGIM